LEEADEVYGRCTKAAAWAQCLGPTGFIQPEPIAGVIQHNQFHVRPIARQLKQCPRISLVRPGKSQCLVHAPFPMLFLALSDCFRAKSQKGVDRVLRSQAVQQRIRNGEESPAAKVKAAGRRKAGPATV
jgi:hypothetical protein